MLAGALHRTLFALVLTLSAWAWGAERQAMRMEVTRDAWVSSVNKETDKNTGGANQLKTKGSQEFALVDLDPAKLKGRVIMGAKLHFKPTSPELQRRVTVSSLASDWVEGTGGSYEAQKGSVTFQMAAQGERPWAWPGSDLMAVSLGEGNTIWRFADATPPDSQGFQSVAVEPRVVAARVAGISWGFVVWDDVGSEYTRNGNEFTYHHMPNRFIASRESGKKTAPYFTIDLGEEDTGAPESVTGLSSKSEGLAHGRASVTWKTPADRGPAGTLGFVVRYAQGQDFKWESAKPLPQYLVPLAAKAGEAVTMELRDLNLPGGTELTLGVRAVDGAGNVGEVGTVKVTLSNTPATVDLAALPVKPFEQVGQKPRLGEVKVSVMDGLDKIHPVSGAMIPKHPDAYLQANHLWSAAEKTIRLFAAKNEAVDFQLVLEGRSDQPISAELKFDEESLGVELSSLRHVATKAGPMPDPVLPLKQGIRLPDEQQKIDGQRFAPILAEIYVPHDAKAGQRQGTLTLKSGQDTLALKVDLTVWDFTLPDYLSFIPEMNSYGLPRASEREYYRLAHKNRTVLNRLGYSWSGRISDDTAPNWDGRQFDWTEYDKRFGSLLDGSAFADLPRTNVPLETFYLPFNENWPIPIEPNFKGGYWIEDALKPEYRAGFVKAAGLYARHLAEKKWNDTIFEFYLNNKVYYKEGEQGSKGDWSRSSAPWIFDEPVNTQDYWALRWYGIAFHEGVGPERGAAKLAYRCDISRPQWQRDMLDGVLDVNVVGGAFRQYLRMVMERKQKFGEITYNYGSSNGPEAANIQPAAWCIETWSAGGDGVLPWQTIGTAKSWTEGDALSLFYPGDTVGSPVPIPSIRLKSYRRGQQDVEYLTLLTQTTGKTREVVGRAALEQLKLIAKVEQRSAEDAGFVGYGAVDPTALWELRVRVGSMLDAAHPPAKRKLVDLNPPKRDVSKLPEMRHVTTAPIR